MATECAPSKTEAKATEERSFKQMGYLAPRGGKSGKSSGRSPKSPRSSNTRPAGAR